MSISIAGALARPLEREAPLAELNRLVSENRPHGRIVLVTGAAGSGKSTLVRYFAEQRATGAQVLVGVCDPAADARPLGPLYDIARQAGGSLAAALASGHRGEVFDAVIEEFAREGRRRVVVFEDLHWADEATLDLLAFLGRRLDRRPAVVVLTYRDDELRVDHPLHAVLAGLPSELTSALPVPPLSADATATLANRAGLAFPDLYLITGGNPLLISELLAADANGVPRKLRALVQTRLAGLGSNARDVVRLAAIEPDGVEPWLLKHAATAGATVLDECCSTGLLTHRGERIGFRYEILRRVLYELLPPAVQRELSQQILAALSHAPPGQDVDPARLVRHALACDDAAAVLAYAPLAASRAAAARAHPEAARYYQTALRYADGLSDEERAGLWERLAAQLFLSGDADRALRGRQVALAAWGASGLAERIGENLRWISRLHRFSGRWSEAESAADQAIEFLEAEEPGAQLVLAYGDRARLHLATHRVSGAIAWGKRALRLALRLRDPAGVAVALSDLGAARLAAGSAVTGRAELNRAHSIAREHGLAEQAARVLADIAAHDIAQHDHRRARVSLEQGFQSAVDDRAPGVVVELIALRALFRTYDGDWAGARDDALAVLDEPGHSAADAALARCTLARLRARRGEGAADEALLGAAGPVRVSGELRAVALLAATRAELSWLGYPADTDPVELSRAFELACLARHPWYAGELAWWLHRAGLNPPLSDWYAEPYRLLLTGQSRQAAAVWKQLGRPYEQADALATGADHDSALHALAIFDQLKADGAARRLRRRLRRLGRLRIPRGPRPATAANPARLTGRQLEVLALLAQGLGNADIAARLSLSVRTVDHHVSAVLRKLAVDTRQQAAAMARQLGIPATTTGPPR